MLPTQSEPKTSWDLAQLNITTQEWIKRAKEKKVDVDDEVHLIVQTIIDAPHNETLSEVTVVQQLMLRGMYTTRIIRKVAEADIKRLAQKGREDPKLSSKISLINDCEKWALSQLPSEWQLGDPAPAVATYYSLQNKLNEMTGKVQSKL